MRILFCDSDKLTQVYITHMLKNLYEVNIVGTKEECLSALEKEDIDLVFISYVFLRDDDSIIKQCEGTPFVIVGASESEIRSVNCFDKLDKPFTKDNVLDIINKLAKKSESDENIEDSSQLRTTSFGIEYLINYIEEREENKGAYQLDFSRFYSVFNFIKRNFTRNNGSVHVLLLTLLPDNEEAKNNYYKAVKCLENAVKETLRINDIFTRFSMNQILVILEGEIEKNEAVIKERIINSFKKEKESEGFSVNSVSKEIEIVQHKEKDSRFLNNEMLESTIFALENAVEAKDKYTNGHSERVATYAKMIAERIGKTEEEQKEIYYAGVLHDVGKIRIPDEIINKNGRLTDQEYSFIKLHPIAGYNILKEIPNMQIVAGAKWHHERYDGKGYPDGLIGENIPEIARIIAVADAYDAMTSTRSYRETMSQEKVRAQIEQGKGTQFDARFADVMLQMIDEDKEYKLRQNTNIVKHVLVIDDELINLVAINALLEAEAGFEVHTANSGGQGIDFVLSNKVDFILLDIEMPDKDGFDVLNVIRPLIDAKIIFCTANKELKTIEKAEEMGVRDYLSKPFMKTELLELLK